MRPSLALIDPTRDLHWNGFVKEHPLGAIYHHSSWLNVLRLTYRQIALGCFVIKSPGGSIRSALPFGAVKSRLGTRLVSIPFTPYCDPLLGDSGDFDRLLEPLTRMIDEGMASYYELRTHRVPQSASNLLVSADFHPKNHVLPLCGGVDQVKKSFHKSCIKRSIDKAVKSGVAVREGVSEDDLQKFFRMHGRIRKRLGLPIQPYGLFKAMWQLMHPEHLGLLIAEHEGRSIGGTVTFNYKETVSLEHIGYDPDWLRVRPNHLLYYKVIEKACAEGYSFVDFRKTSPDNQGLLQFKKRWGAEESDITYFYYPDVRKGGSLAEGTARRKMFGLVNRALPFLFANAVSRIVYRHIG